MQKEMAVALGRREDWLCGWIGTAWVNAEEWFPRTGNAGQHNERQRWSAGMDGRISGSGRSSNVASRLLRWVLAMMAGIDDVGAMRRRDPASSF